MPSHGAPALGHHVRGRTCPRLLNHKSVHTCFARTSPATDTVYSRTIPRMGRPPPFDAYPVFFPIHSTGKRSGSVQLCPGNFAWGKELAQTILKQLALDPHKDSIHWDTARTRSAFSYCADSKALEREHQWPGGPVCASLTGLRRLLEAAHLRTSMRTLACRRPSMHGIPRGFTYRPGVVSKKRCFPHLPQPESTAGNVASMRWRSTPALQRRPCSMSDNSGAS